MMDQAPVPRNVLRANRDNCIDAAALITEYELDDVIETFEGRAARLLTSVVKNNLGTSRELLVNEGNVKDFRERFGGDETRYERALLGEPLKLLVGLYLQCVKMATQAARSGYTFDADGYVEGAAKNRGWGEYNKTSRKEECREEESVSAHEKEGFVS